MKQQTLVTLDYLYQVCTIEARHFNKDDAFRLQLDAIFAERRAQLMADKLNARQSTTTTTTATGNQRTNDRKATIFDPTLSLGPKPKRVARC
jgi:hypothetical protein